MVGMRGEARQRSQPGATAMLPGVVSMNAARRRPQHLKLVWSADAAERTPPAVDDDGPEHMAVFVRGYRCAEVGEFDTAAQCFRETIKIKPDFAEAHNNLGAALDARGKSRDAIRAFRAAIKVRPNFSFAYANLGLALYRRGQVAAAITTLRDRLKIDPECAELYAALGVVLGQTDELSLIEGIAAFRTAVKLKPDYAVAYYNLGDALSVKGDFPKAIAALRHAIKIDPDFADAHFLLASCLYRTGQLVPAIKSYNESLRIQQDYGPSLCGLGMAFGRNGDIAASIAAFGNALQAAPDDEHDDIVKIALDTFDYYSAQSGIIASDDDTEHIVKVITTDYTFGSMGDATGDFEAIAAARGLSVAELSEAIDNYTAARSALTARDNTARVTAPPRLKWEPGRQPDENPAQFAWRAYQAEAKAGTLHRGVIYREDRELHRRLNSWLRSNEMPEGIDVPTLPEWNTRQIEAAKAGGKPLSAPSTPEARLREAARYRALKSTHRHL
jgi:tetratricopeptide (TPR) repeat protein